MKAFHQTMHLTESLFLCLNMLFEFALSKLILQPAHRHAANEYWISPLACLSSQNMFHINDITDSQTVTHEAEQSSISSPFIDELLVHTANREKKGAGAILRITCLTVFTDQNVESHILT